MYLQEYFVDKHVKTLLDTHFDIYWNKAQNFLGEFKHY